MQVNIDNLSKSYPTPSEHLVILESLSLQLDSGDSLAIQGPSGCGKSTLLHILGTLETPDSGSVLLGDVDPFSLSEKELASFRNREIGFVFQDHYLLPQCTVLENVLLPTMVSGGVQDENEARAMDLLRRVGLTERSGHRPSELSGGERQRAAIARALIGDPGLLLCDEPTGNLDAESAGMVADLFVELHTALSATLVVVTHSGLLAGRFRRRLELAGRNLREAAD